MRAPKIEFKVYSSITGYLEALGTRRVEYRSLQDQTGVSGFAVGVPKPTWRA